jgi:uncharacterized membrane protein YphA (DoxX/SURF4 family)
VKQKITIEIACSLLILLFIYAAFSKLFDYKTFQQQLKASALLHPFFPILAWAVPLIEIGISLMLIIDRTRLLGLYASLLILLLFTIYIIIMLFSVSHLPCSCGGIIKKLSWRQHIAFNSAFIFLTALTIQLLKKQKILLYNNVQ